MRAIVRKTYPGYEWHKKVDKMSDAQIIAVYYRLLDTKLRTNLKGVK